MNTVDSVWRKVVRRGPNQCWEWTGYFSSGRGRIDIGREKGVYVARAAYVSANPDCGLPLKAAPDGIMVLHRCDNPKCCNPRHLFLGSHADNMADKVSKGRQYKPGSVNSPRAKLTAEQVQEIRRRKSDGETKKALAAAYGVSECTISSACYGRTYQDQPAVPMVRHKFAQKLTTEDVIEIRARHANGERARILAEKYGVTERAIHRVLKRWKGL